MTRETYKASIVFTSDYIGQYQFTDTKCFFQKGMLYNDIEITLLSDEEYYAIIDCPTNPELYCFVPDDVFIKVINISK